MLRSSGIGRKATCALTAGAGRKRVTKHRAPTGLITSRQSGSVKWPSASISASSAAFRAEPFLASTRSISPLFQWPFAPSGTVAQWETLGLISPATTFQALDRIYRPREGLVLLGFRHRSRHDWYLRSCEASGWRFCTYDAHKYGHLTGRSFSPRRHSSEADRSGSRQPLGFRLQNASLMLLVGSLSLERHFGLRQKCRSVCSNSVTHRLPPSPWQM